MFTSILVFLCGFSPRLRRLLWRWWYSKLARQIDAERWTFMNYGLAAQDGERLKLQPADEPDRLCIQLYDAVAGLAPLEGKEVLEVGCGRGGGASYLARYRQTARMVGMDYSAEAVAYCRQRHQSVAALEFVMGDAENLPFEDGSFDSILNVESSHCYGNVGKFFAEVYRVLRPGGWFLFADLRGPAEAAGLEALLARLPWEVVEQEDITARVVQALEEDDVRKRAMIDELIPLKLRPLFSEFAGITGGKIHRGFTRRELIYLRFAMHKPV